MHSFFYMQDIEEEIMSWDFAVTRYYVLSCMSTNQGNLTMLIGHLRRIGSTRTRKFAQAIFFAPDNFSNDYYVLNEIFHFLDEPDHDESTVTSHPDEITDDNDPNSLTYVTGNSSFINHLFCYTCNLYFRVFDVL